MIKPGIESAKIPSGNPPDNLDHTASRFFAEPSIHKGLNHL